MKRNVIAIASIIFFHAQWFSAIHAAEPGNSRIGEELIKQENIYRSKEGQVPEGYVIDRSLADYAQTLPSDFERALGLLGPKDRWLDIGAGRGQAILDYFSTGGGDIPIESKPRRGRKASAVALSIEDRRTALWHKTANSLEANQMQYLFDKLFRDYSPEQLGRFQVITDLLGGFSYSDNLSLFMEKALGVLDLNGTFYTLLQDVKSESGANRPFYANSPYLTEIIKADGTEKSVCNWLKNISCAEVTCELRPQWKPPIEVYRIQKICHSVVVPELTQIHFSAGTPPERRYRLNR